MKRLLDFITAFLAILLLWPIILIIVLVVWWRLGQPIFFCQQRPGLYGKLFNIYKFRTMLLQYDEYGELLPDSKRMTALGIFLRQYSLDELPQLFNVIKGDLSLVGPRPLLTEYLPLYTGEQARRHHVRPGISGWAQVNGRNSVSWEDKFKYDVWYVDHQSFWLDLKILWMTVIKIIFPEGISQDGNVTMERFQGTGEENNDSEK